eukprot:CAMPEP_0203979518 /NCGR_PEP_ID=MMETSP0360-20130528/692_1 /ASSEMBLY_ACC=CAM_ASM_000342 /TAXON_ID=268821 /ORGANISM="Scrippsiella Hangoei, Strain SHTV-5" /LENGTH=65 /DNA_ID=CAMNT_0050917805 /DNA_START=26 /DNA_END=221 /DNA_ORIENTATION=-
MSSLSSNFEVSSSSFVASTISPPALTAQVGRFHAPTLFGLVLADLANLVHKSCLSNSSSFTHGLF